MALNNTLAADMILFVLLLAAGYGVFPLAFADLFVGGTFHRGARLIFPHGNEIAGSANIPHFGNRLSGGKPFGNFKGLTFAHAEGKQIRAGIHQNGGQNLVAPVVIVGEPPQRGLYSAYDNRAVGIN